MLLSERKTQPKADNKCYIITSKGGYNKCIEIKKGSVLPNCTGYCYGRYMEANKITSCKLPTCNAESWFFKKYTKNFKVGQDPKVGAIVVWSKGKVGKSSDGAGHVAFIEHINYNKDSSIKSIHVSESGAGASSKVWTEDIKPPFIYKKGYKLEGFIYSPNEFEDTNKPKQPTTLKRFILLFNKKMRTGAGVNYKVIKTLKTGTVIQSIDNKIYKAKTGSKWIKCTLSGKKGFVCIVDKSGLQAKEI